MSFRFEWPEFNSGFYDQAKELLRSALNKGDKPQIIADRIDVNHLDMGSIPPDLEILEIGDLGTDRFRGIFRLSYAGDASIGLTTKIQANPLRQKSAATSPDILSSPSILFASTPLVVPMNLKLSSLKLRAIVVLVVSRLEGVTLVFKNDPLESVEVSSTFDSVSAIQAFVQSEIERQLRELFRTELPGIIHQLSRRWIKSQPTSQRSPSSVPLLQSSSSHSSSSSSSASLISASSLEPRIPHCPSPLMASVPDAVESYDPTYGLRPSHPPLVGKFTRYRSLVAKKTRKQGLGTVLESEDESEDEHGVLAISPSCPPTPPPSLSHHPHGSTPHRTPSTKPRILRSHSALISPGAPSSSSAASCSTRRVFTPDTQPSSPNAWSDAPSLLIRDRPLSRFALQKIPIHKPKPIIHLTDSSTTSSLPSRPSRPSRFAVYSRLSTPSYSCEEDEGGEEEAKDELEIMSPDSSHCHLLASLARTNCTLSPFTRSIPHCAARSTPPCETVIINRRGVEDDYLCRQKRVTKIGQRRS